MPAALFCKAALVCRTRGRQGQALLCSSNPHYFNRLLKTLHLDHLAGRKDLLEKQTAFTPQSALPLSSMSTVGYGRIMQWEQWAEASLTDELSEVSKTQLPTLAPLCILFAVSLDCFNMSANTLAPTTAATWQLR